jgi:hypothetical protein
MGNMINVSKRRVVIICIMVLIAATHIFRVGGYLHGELFNFYYGYFSDFIIPFGGYFLLCAAELDLPFLRRWKVKLAIAFLIPSIAETCQYFGMPVFGSTFDLLDYFMYALGVTLAAIFDIQVFSRLFDFWNIKKTER